MKNKKGELLVIGCNYHTTWQSDRRMRFVLAEIKGDKARLTTTRTRRNFWTDIEDLIFIKTNYNKNKANEFLKESMNESRNS